MTTEEVKQAVAGWDATRTALVQQADLADLITPYLSKEVSVGKASGKDTIRLMQLIRLMTYCTGPLASPSFSRLFADAHYLL